MPLIDARHESFECQVALRVFAAKRVMEHAPDELALGESLIPRGALQLSVELRVDEYLLPDHARHGGPPAFLVPYPEYTPMLCSKLCSVPVFDADVRPEPHPAVRIAAVHSSS